LLAERRHVAIQYVIRRLAKPSDLVDQAERQLRRPPSDFTKKAWRQRSLRKLISLGVPGWLAHAVEWINRPAPPGGAP
jgi:hypothetical protein